MSIFVFELGKLPEQIDSGNILELFLRAFRADTEDELETLEKLGVHEMNEMITAYREITSSPDYVDLERKRLMNSLDEGKALRNAERRGEARANARWQKRLKQIVLNGRKKLMKSSRKTPVCERSWVSSVRRICRGRRGGAPQRCPIFAAAIVLPESGGVIPFTLTVVQNQPSVFSTIPVIS
jgi:hypothetical protein